MSIEQEVKDKAAQTQQVELKVKELETINRICGNAINLINDMEVKGAYAKPVAEVTDWLTGLKTQIQAQIDQFKTMLPKEESVTPTVIEAEVVK
jgi:hypothetical protein